MSSRVTTRAVKNISALTGLLFGATLLAGCSSLGLPTTALNSDELITGSIGAAGQGNLNQAMPGVLQGSGVSNSTSGPYLPPGNVGGANVITSTGVPLTTASVSNRQLPPISQNSSTIVSAQALPAPLQSSSVGSSQTMSAQNQSAAIVPARVTQPFPDNAVPQVAPPRNAIAVASAAPAAPALTVVAPATYKHTVESGESLYAIARRYDVTTDAIVRANGLSSPDQIFVGQDIAIPGRADLLASRAVPSTPDTLTTASVPAPATQVVAAPAAQPASPPVAAPAATPIVVATTDANLTTADGFRWPVNGRVITNFIDSNRTGINIEAPDGASVRAAENGTVIYVGSGVEGFGNLVLVRHSNGYVSAYAHLKDATIANGTAVLRGDQLGTVGMSGSVNRPQLHFELRQGATPVDPMPLLAS